MNGTTSITNLLSRQRWDLGGKWRVIVDPYEMGYVGIMGDRNPRGFFRDFRQRHPGDRVEYDFDSSQTLTVPGDWNTQDERLLYYEGTVWYRRHIDVDASMAGACGPGTRLFVSIGAANHTARVFLDGEELATHVGGFGPFAVEVTERLSVGRHSLVVQVDNRREPDRIPAMRSDWWNFGGLTRAVELVATPPVFLRDAWATMAPDASIVGDAVVDGAEGDTQVTLEIAGRSVPFTQGEGCFLDLDVERWAPGRPVLHPLRFRLDDPSGAPIDHVDDLVGFRTVEVEGTDVVVNGKPTFLRGISTHAEALSGGRRSHGPADAAAIFDRIEELGANFVRLAHYQHDEYMVREADRRGILAWCELPVYWGIAFDDTTVLDNARAQLDELVVRDRSRAAVIIWSVANETMPSPDRTAFLADLANRARHHDPTRLVSAALLTLPTADSEHAIDDPLGEHVDVVAVNQYLGWYYGDRDALADTQWSTEVNKPILFTEFGAGAKAGRHGDDGEIWTEEFQAAVYVQQIEMIRRQRSGRGGAVAGCSPWILKDFRAPVRVLPGIQDGYNRKGVLSEENEPKLAFDVLRDFYADLADDR
ncbi:MAG: glycoside hydrolase family 2 TIM barrel-domain containing protein [Actinomycetota bacterium]